MVFLKYSPPPCIVKTTSIARHGNNQKNDRGISLYPISECTLGKLREIVPLLTVKPKSRRKWVARVTESSSPVVSFTSPGWAETSGYFLAGKGNMGKDTESGAGLVLVRPERVSALDQAERLSDPL